MLNDVVVIIFELDIVVGTVVAFELEPEVCPVGGIELGVGVRLETVVLLENVMDIAAVASCELEPRGNEESGGGVVRVVCSGVVEGLDAAEVVEPPLIPAVVVLPIAVFVFDDVDVEKQRPLVSFRLVDTST